jgi:hypothetical protein
MPNGYACLVDFWLIGGNLLLGKNMNEQQLIIQKKLQRLDELEKQTPKYAYATLQKIARIRQQLKNAIIEYEEEPFTVIYKKKLEEHQKKQDEERQKRKEKEDADKKAGHIPLTQKEQRELKRQQREKEATRAKLDQAGIEKSCAENGECKVTIEDLKNAFPKMVSQIEGNTYRTQIDNKQFYEFLTSNGLTFTFPDYIFRKVN